MQTKIIFASLILCLISTFMVAQPNSTGVKEKRKDLHTTKEIFLDAKTIEDLLSGFPKNEFEVVSYKLTIVQKTHNLVKFDAQNNELSAAMLEKIKSLPAGSLLFVEYVKGRRKNGSDKLIRNFPPASFVIEE